MPHLLVFIEADDEARTRDLRLGKPTLYQLSYVRVPRDSRRPLKRSGVCGARLTQDPLGHARDSGARELIGRIPGQRPLYAALPKSGLAARSRDSPL